MTNFFAKAIIPDKYRIMERWQIMAEFHLSRTNEGITALANNDTRLGQVRVFDKTILTHMAVSENGYIGIYQPGGENVAPTAIPFKFKREDVPESLQIIHISMVNEFDVVVDNQSGLGGAILGGLVAGGAGMIVGQALSSGKAKSIDLQIKTSDFNNPQILVSLFRAETFGSVLGTTPSQLLTILKRATPQQREEEILELMSQIDNIRHAHASSQKSGTIHQQSNDAEELIQLKKLVDDGVITLDEFNAKKKQILGL